MYYQIIPRWFDEVNNPWVKNEIRLNLRITENVQFGSKMKTDAWAKKFAMTVNKIDRLKYETPDEINPSRKVPRARN